MLVVPSRLIQPFDAIYLRDDLHVISFFEGHPEYEAVEAMIRRSSDCRYRVRAILTRRDQSQVDYVTDETRDTNRLRDSGVRETHQADITVLEQPTDRGLFVRVGFRSARGEDVLLSLQPVAPADSAYGGLSDPGRHAGTTSLPIMWRGKSALAGPGTTVTIDSIPYEVPERFRLGPTMPVLHGFLTESHDMLVVRAGTVAWRVLSVPTEARIGQSFRYEREGELVEYRIEDVATDGTMRVEGRTTSVEARLTPAGLEIESISLRSENDSGATAKFQFSDQAFEVIVGGHPTVSGTVLAATDGLTLSPTQPAWAVARNVAIRWNGTDDRRAVVTSIINDAPAG